MPFIRPAFIAAGLLAMAPAWAAPSFGLTVGLSDANTLIAVPVQISPALRLEPFAAHNKSSQRDAGAPTRSSFASSDSAVGLGLMGLRPVSEKVSLRGGLRVGYHWSKQQSDFSWTKSTGYSLEPAAGFEVAIDRRLVVGAEASFFTRRSKVREGSFAGETSSRDRYRSTGSRVTLSYFFD